jgi:hypothetical protein
MVLTEEHKEKMRLGRAKAAAERKANPKPPVPARAAKPRTASAATSKPVASPEFLGITKSECCIDCTAQKCVISGANVCAHPCKGGLQASLMTRQDAVERYNRARKQLAHVELDRRP